MGSSASYRPSETITESILVLSFVNTYADMIFQPISAFKNDYSVPQEPAFKNQCFWTPRRSKQLIYLSVLIGLADPMARAPYKNRGGIEISLALFFESQNIWFDKKLPFNVARSNRVGATLNGKF